MRRTSSYSVVARLSLAFAFVAALVFALIGTMLYISLAGELERRDDIEIQGKLDQFRQIARGVGSVQAVAASRPVFQEVLLSHPDVSLLIQDPNGHVLAQSNERFQRAWGTVDFARHAQGKPFSMPLPGGGQARCVFAVQHLSSGESVRIALLRTASDRVTLLESYRRDVLWMGALGALCIATLGYGVARRALRPVKEIGMQTARIEATRLTERLDIKGAPRELQEIATAVNRMLDRLERAFIRLSQFSSDLAHDMRTPLANIISSCEITLSRSRTTDEYETLIESNIEECERIRRMVDSMLFLARADNAAPALKLTKVDALAELNRLASYFQGPAEEDNLTLRVDARGMIDADLAMFLRAVSNLVSNALEHAAPGTDVTMRAAETEWAATVSVSNHGATIAPEHLDQIFDRFYRVDASRTESSKNAGLGLAIVKSIMELHRGRVEVTSAADVTTFSLIFPRPPASAAATHIDICRSPN